MNYLLCLFSFHMQSFIRKQLLIHGFENHNCAFTTLMIYEEENELQSDK